MPDRSRYQIVPIGSVARGFALKVDGIITRSNPNALPLAAYVDANMAGASDFDADFIAKAIERRAWPPTYEERTAPRVTVATAPPDSSRRVATSSPHW